MTRPIDAIIVDNIKVSKGSFRNYIAARLAFVLASASEIQALDMAGCLAVTLGRVTYAYDAADTTTAHDGDTCLVSFDGRRYKSASGLPAGSVDAAELADGAIEEKLGYTPADAADLAVYAPLASPALSGTPTAPTAAVGTNTDQVATTAFIKAAIDALIDASPGALDTLNELAAALGDDPNFATTVTNALANKLPSASYTAADVLAKLLTVDGSGSGLDADMLRGTAPTAFGLSLIDDADAAAARTTLGLDARYGLLINLLTALGGAVDTTNDQVAIYDASAGAERKISVASLVSAGTAGVSTFEGRSGAVVSQPGDYSASEVTNVPAGNIAGSTVQDAINELDAEKAPLSGPVFAGGQSLPAGGGFKFIKCILLADSTNLDTITDAGVYDINNPVNGPYSGVSWGYLEVIRHSNAATYCLQRYTLLVDAGDVCWQRRRNGGTWTAWKPIAGYVTPAHFGGTGGSSLSAASTDDTTAIGRWLDYGLANPSVPLTLDRFYKITSSISKSIAGLNGFGIRSLGPAARAGFYMSGTTAQLAFSGADHSNPSGFDADQYHFSDFMIGVDADRSASLLSLVAAADSGAAAPGLHMSNVHVRRSGDGFGVTGESFYFEDIRQFDVSNVSAQGKYFGYSGNMFRLSAKAGGAPVEGAFTNCRADHFAKMFFFDASAGATANDDWQGMHLDRCSALAVNMLVHATTGPEGFSEWLTIDRCHAYFREIGIYAENVGNVKAHNNYLLGHGSLSTIQGIALTGTSIVPQADVSHNTIKLDPASGATRIGINVPTMGGVAAHNRIKGATSNNFGSLVQTDNAAF